jgi:hypothetical protein
MSIAWDFIGMVKNELGGQFLMMKVLRAPLSASARLSSKSLRRDALE